MDWFQVSATASMLPPVSCIWLIQKLGCCNVDNTIEPKCLHFSLKALRFYFKKHLRLIFFHTTNQTLLLFLQVMFVSSIMNIQVTTIKHLTLEIISMNLQVSRIKNITHKKKTMLRKLICITLPYVCVFIRHE